MKAFEHKHQLKRNYGITVEQYNEFLRQQGGVCAICSNVCLTGRRLAVDHCHESHEVRGLLCTNCNQGLGKFQDSPELLSGAADYLKRRIHVV